MIKKCLIHSVYKSPRLDIFTDKIVDAAVLFLFILVSQIIRIYHECEGRIEKSVPTITLWHHKACRVLTNGDPEGWIFYPTLTRIMDSFSCSPLVFTLK